MKFKDISTQEELDEFSAFCGFKEIELEVTENSVSWPKGVTEHIIKWSNDAHYINTLVRLHREGKLHFCRCGHE